MYYLDYYYLKCLYEINVLFFILCGLFHFSNNKKAIILYNHNNLFYFILLCYRKININNISFL